MSNHHSPVKTFYSRPVEKGIDYKALAEQRKKEIEKLIDLAKKDQRTIDNLIMILNNGGNREEVEKNIQRSRELREAKRSKAKRSKKIKEAAMKLEKKMRYGNKSKSVSPKSTTSSSKGYKSTTSRSKSQKGKRNSGTSGMPALRTVRPTTSSGKKRSTKSVNPQGLAARRPTRRLSL